MSSLLLRLALCGTVVLSSSASADDTMIVPASAEERSAILDAADVWRAVDATKIDMWAGPDDKFPVRGSVSCQFEEFSSYWAINPLGGKTKKFRCLYVDSKGKSDSIKVKYGSDYRSWWGGHLYGEIASSRLLWALGFGADRMYPVRLECRNCPKDPWEYLHIGNMGEVSPGELASMNQNARDNYDRVSVRGDWVFLPAAIEKKYKGVEIGLFEKQGWGFDELRRYKNVSRERAIHRDALTLLAGGFLHHADNKAENQRLVCPENKVLKSAEGNPVGCSKPFALIHDLGWTWGAGFGLDKPGQVSKMNLDDWKTTSIFKGKTGCVINSRAASITKTSLGDVEVSEEGRLFLIDLLKNLDKGQVTTLPLSGGGFVMTPTMQLFFVSYVDLAEIYADRARDVSLEENMRRSVLRWTDAFHAKVRELEGRKCAKHIDEIH